MKAHRSSSLSQLIIAIAITLPLLNLYMHTREAMERRPQLPRSAEMRVRDRVVQLNSERGSCSGVQVRTAKGADVILTAAHCRVLAEDGSILAAFDGQRPIPRRVMEESPTADLMLLEGLPDREGIVVARSYDRLERITALTHALGLPTRLDEGELLLQAPIEIPILAIASEDDERACGAQPKNKVAETWLGKVCVMAVTETISNIRIEPGSSGGPAVNVKGQLVAIASAGNASLSAWVTLKDIQDFLRPY